MIKTTQMKYIRFLFLEPHFKWRIFIFVILVVMLSLQSNFLAKQNATLKAMVATIEMKRKDLQNKRQVRDKPVAVQETQYILRGVSEFDGIHYAVINKEIYARGDTIGHYVVKQITSNCVILEDKTTQKLRKLEYLTEFND